MEQAAETAISTLLGQLGFAGLGLGAIAALGFWWLKASRDLRDEKEGVIVRLGSDKDRLKAKLAEVEAERDKYREAYLALKYPGSHADPFEGVGE
ncbi:hypothetical protein [Zhihengliuella flava]|uniref:Uncharacterized protein n=1 Tax=Zhihengliuella flava TaxID=1285193 RepID=A0A931DBA7_9MICC|nr:hypothetical protein [Zhihengliuella flava]MBG6085804.1 hypothetical protein [Zhihengliuella flava]MBG6085882.1 hypothetical protein [Zhihengliuella flava]